MSQVTALLCRRFGFDRFRLGLSCFALRTHLGERRPDAEATRKVDRGAPGDGPSPAPRSDEGEPGAVGVQVRPGRGMDRHLAHSHSGAGPPEVRPSREDETLAAGLHDVGGKRRRDHAPPREDSQPAPSGKSGCKTIGSARHLGGVGGGGPTCRARLWSAGTRQTSRLQVAAWLGLGPPLPTKRRSRVVAGIQWVRLPDTMHTPITGVAKRASSPNTVITHETKPYSSHMANFSRFAN